MGRFNVTMADNAEAQFLAALAELSIEPIEVTHHVEALNAWRKSLFQTLSAKPISCSILAEQHALAEQITAIEQDISQYDHHWEAQWQQRLPAQALARYFDDKLMFLVYGKFNAGKSSFCNFIAERFLAQNHKADFFTVNNGEIEWVAGPFQEGSTETTAQIQGLLLAERMVLLDTPGLHSLTEDNAQLTQQFLDSADGVLWLSNSTSPGQVQELDTLIQELQRRKPLLPIITRSDFIDEDIVNGEFIKIVCNKTADNRHLQEKDLRARAVEKLQTLGVDSSVLQPALSISVYAAKAQGCTDEALAQAGFFNVYQALNHLLKEMVAYKQRKPAEVLLHHLEEDVLTEVVALQSQLEKLDEQMTGMFIDFKKVAQSWTQFNWQECIGRLPAVLDEHIAQHSSLEVFWSELAAHLSTQLEQSSRQYFASYTPFFKSPMRFESTQTALMEIGELSTAHYESIYHCLEKEIAMELQSLEERIIQKVQQHLEHTQAQIRERMQQVIEYENALEIIRTKVVHSFCG